MKQFCFLLILFFVLLGTFDSSALASTILISPSTQPDFRPSGLPAIRTGTAGVTDGDTQVVLTTPVPANWVGIGGQIIELNGVNYYVSNTNTTSSVTLTTAYAGSTGTASYRVFPFVLLRVYALSTFQPNGANYVVQQGAPGSGSWYKQVGVSVISDGANSTAYIPSITLDATTDAVNPATQNSRYFAGFYRIEGGLISPFLCFEQFRLPTVTPTSWSAICTYNQTNTQPNDPTTYYTARQLDDRWRACAAGQSYYFAASGVRLSCLTYGSGLTLDNSTGILTADVQIEPPTLQNQGVNLTKRATQNFQLPFIRGVDIPETSATNVNLSRTPTGVYNAVTDLNISADPRLYETTTVISSGATSVVLTGVTKEARNGITDTSTNSVYPLAYKANSLNTWRVGQGIRIPDGASSGVHLIATITAVNGNTLTFTPATTNANAIDFVQHDDTAAVRGFFSTYTAGTLQIPDGWIPVSSFYNYDANHPYAISFPASSEASNHQWVIEGSEKYRSAFLMTGPGHLLKPSTTSPNSNLTIKNLGLFHANRYQLQTLDNTSAGAGLYLASDQFTLGDGVPQSGATAIHLENLHFIGWKYAIFSDNLQSSHFRNLSIYYCNNGIVLPATSNVRGLGSQTEPNANQIEQTFIQYSPVLTSNARRTVTVTTAGAHNTSGTDIGDASAIVTITSGAVSSDDLYRLVAIAGASVNQTQHTALITRVIDSTHVELSQPPWIANTGLTMTLYPRAFAHFYTNNGNNIQIRGGTWQGNWTNVSSGDELYAMLVENSDEITMEGIWIEGNGGSGGSAVQANSVRNLRIINSNFGAGGTPSGYGVGLRLNNVLGATIDGAYIATSGDAAADIFLENGTRGVSVDNTTLTSPQSILYGNLLDTTPDFYPPKLGLGMRYLEGTNSGPVYDAGDLYNTFYARNQLANGNLAQGGTSWTLTAPAALTFVNTGTARGLRYVRVAPTTGGGGAYAEQMSQTINVPDSIPENQTVTLGFDFYIESRGAEGGSIYDGLRVKLVPSVGATGQFGYGPSTAQGKLLGRWERGSVTTRIGAGTGRTLKVQLECGTGADAAVFRLSNFRLTYGTKATFDDDEVISELRGGMIQTPSTLTFNGVSNGCAQFTSGYLTSTGLACGSGGGGGLTSITPPAGGAQTGPGIAFALGTAGTDVSISGSANTITFNFPTSSASNRGFLSPSDFSTFTAKIGGSIGNTQIGVGSGTSLSGSSALVYASNLVNNTVNTNGTTGFQSTNANAGAAANVEFGAYTGASSLRMVATGSGWSVPPGTLYPATSAILDAGTGTNTLLFSLNDSGGTKSMRWGIGQVERMRLNETGLALGTTTPDGKLRLVADANDELIKGTGYSLTGSSAVNMVDLAGTWNTTGAPTAIKLNITDTASDSASQLAALQVGGTDKWAVRKDGAITTGNTYTGANTFSTSTNVFSSRAEFSSFYLDAPGSFNLRIVPGAVLTGDRQLTITTPVGSNATWNVQGNLGLGGDLNSSASVTLGSHALTFTTTGVTNVTLPTSGTLSASSPTPAFAILTDGATITWTFTGPQLYSNATVTLGGNRTLAFSGTANGARGSLKVVQDGTGSRTLTLPAGSKVSGGGGGACTLSTAANAIDLLTFYYDGTNYFWTCTTNFN